jgi:hypothetical protein
MNAEKRTGSARAQRKEVARTTAAGNNTHLRSAMVDQKNICLSKATVEKKRTILG